MPKCRGPRVDRPAGLLRVWVAIEPSMGPNRRAQERERAATRAKANPT
jgi:hypothetical protein